MWRLLPVLLCAVAPPAAAAEVSTPSIAEAFTSAAPRCPAEVKRCFGVHLHVASREGKPVQTPVWFAEQLARTQVSLDDETSAVEHDDTTRNDFEQLSVVLRRDGGRIDAIDVLVDAVDALVELRRQQVELFERLLQALQRSLFQCLF